MEGGQQPTAPAEGGSSCELFFPAEIPARLCDVNAASLSLHSLGVGGLTLQSLLPRQRRIARPFSTTYIRGSLEPFRESGKARALIKDAIIHRFFTPF